MHSQYRNTVLVPVIHTRCCICLDELSKTYSAVSRNQLEKSWLSFVRAQDPSGLTGLGAVYVECGGQTWPIKMLTYTNINTQRK